MNCHPERNEGPAVRRNLQISRFAQDARIWWSCRRVPALAVDR